jgi:hypothetical protein
MLTGNVYRYISVLHIMPRGTSVLANKRYRYRQKKCLKLKRNSYEKES